MKTLTAVGIAAAIVAAMLILPGVFSNAQEAKQQAQSTLVATIDLSPIQTELAAMRAEMAALRQAVADPKGLRDEVGQAVAATKALDARLGELVELVKKQSDALRPAILALDPGTLWEYQCLRTRSEKAINQLARSGWQLVSGADEWLYFRRPLAPARRTERVPEPEKQE